MTPRQSTGVRRLDDLLKGGVPQGSFTIVYGPPFLGKDVLARRFALAALAAGRPCITVLTDGSASAVRSGLLAADPAYAKAEQAGLAHFIDAYSRSIGAAEAAPGVEYVEGAMDLNGISLAINNAQRRILPEHPTHRLVFDGLSTLVTYTNAATVFRFLQVLIGRARLAGATGLLLLEQGMHAEAEVQMLKHLVDGFVEVRSEGGKNLLRVQGVGITDDPGWVEYRFTETEFDIVGSFASGRIR